MTDVPRLSCDEVAELTGGYALDALSTGERQAVEAHVDECELHEEISQLRLAAASVALSVDEVAPPSELRDRVLAIPDAGIVAFEAEPTASRLLAFIRRPSVAYGFAAALAAFALLVGLRSATRPGATAILRSSPSRTALAAVNIASSTAPTMTSPCCRSADSPTSMRASSTRCG